MQELGVLWSCKVVCRSFAAVRTGSEHAYGPSLTVLSRAPPGWLVACTSAGCCCCSGSATFCSAEGGCPGSGRCGDPMLDTDSSSAEPTDCSVPSTPSVLDTLSLGRRPSEARSMMSLRIPCQDRSGQSGPQGPFHHTRSAILPTAHNYLSVTVL